VTERGSALKAAVTSQAHGIDPRFEILADEKLHMGAAFSIRDIRAKRMPDPSIRSASIEHFADQRQFALSNEIRWPGQLLHCHPG